MAGWLESHAHGRENGGEEGKHKLNRGLVEPGKNFSVFIQIGASYQHDILHEGVA